ncbi:MAG: sugar phosphate isomerase/epimerase [Verrucomicrobia bacterium]|nr:sugar phosphate isomerase/epimerase [Verrucomicrobiota bacterium]
MKIGIYSITYRGVWYRGDAIDLFQLPRLVKSQGWEGLELDTERPHAAPMDLTADDRRRFRDLAGELDLPISAVSPNCDLSSPVASRQEATICYVRECIKLTHDLGAPICKIFAAWRGITMHDGIGSYDLTYGHDPYPFWQEDRRRWVVPAIRELAAMAGDHGIVLAVQNHGPDIVNNYRDTLSLIEEVGSPHFKACMDINIEDEPESEQRAAEMVRASGNLQVHSHVNGEFVRDADGRVVLAGAGYFDQQFWGRKVAYPAYFDALVAAGYDGFMDWEFCHPAMENGECAGLGYVHHQTELALEYMKTLRAEAQQKTAGNP